MNSVQLRYDFIYLYYLLWLLNVVIKDVITCIVLKWAIERQPRRKSCAQKQWSLTQIPTKVANCRFFTGYPIARVCLCHLPWRSRYSKLEFPTHVGRKRVSESRAEWMARGTRCVPMHPTNRMYKAVRPVGWRAHCPVWHLTHFENMPTGLSLGTKHTAHTSY